MIDGQNGFVVWDSDAAFAGRLRELLANPTLRQRMGDFAAKMADEWSWDRLAPKWQQRILDIIGSAESRDSRVRSSGDGFAIAIIDRKIEPYIVSEERLRSRKSAANQSDEGTDRLLRRCVWTDDQEHLERRSDPLDCIGEWSRSDRGRAPDCKQIHARGAADEIS